MRREVESQTPYLDQVTRLIPAEIVAAHLTIQGLVYGKIQIRDTVIEISAVVLLLGLPFYLRWLRGITAPREIVLTMGSFVVWVLAVSLPIHQKHGIDPIWGSIILILWTTLAVPIFAVIGTARNGR